MQNTVIIAILFVIGLLIVGWFSWNITEKSPVDQEQISDGIAIYRRNYCGSCHTLSIANTRGIFAPNHDNLVVDSHNYLASETYTGIASTIEAYIRESIVDPTIFYTPGYASSNHHMPSFRHLPEEDINALVYMLGHQASYTGED